MAKVDVSSIFDTKIQATTAFPKVEKVADIIEVKNNDAQNVYSVLDAGNKTGIPVMFIGAPGNGKTAAVNEYARLLGADVVYFGPNSAPSSAVIPGIGNIEVNGETVEFIDFLMEEKLKGDKPKVIICDEISRMGEAMRQMMLEVLGPKPRIAGQDINNVVLRVCTGNRTEDGVDALDPALTTRVITVPVRASSTPWKYYVSAEFADVDLKAAFKFHDSLDPQVRELVSPRKVRKLIWNLLNHSCGWPALAITDGGYEKFIDSHGRDVTRDVIDGFAAALGTASKDKLDDPIGAAISAAVDHGQTVFVEGPPGIGKTTELEVKLRERRPDAKVMTISMANASPEDFSLVMIKDGKLKRTLNRFFAEDGEKYLIADEVWRAPDDVMDCMLELFQERSVAGIDTGLNGIIALNNPRDLEGHQLDVGDPDTAQSDRFTMNISVNASHMGFRSYLINTYGDTAEHFIEWWEGLSQLDQSLYNVRVLEQAIKWYLIGMPLSMTTPWYDGMPMEISFLELERRLADRPLVKIKEVTANVDKYVEELSAPGGQDGEAHRAVFDAFDRADIVQLKAAEDACLTLLPLLSQQAKINLLRAEKEKRAFWLSLVSKSAKQK